MTLTVATWNVNGIRAREEQFLEWVAAERPDVVCLQELKAAQDQLSERLCELTDYHCYWHGHAGYSGVGLHLRRATFPEAPEFAHPDFDHETRIVTATVRLGGAPAAGTGPAATLAAGDAAPGSGVAAPEVTFASIYVPNGGKDFQAKLDFLAGLRRLAGDLAAAERSVILCGDLNVTRTDADLHPKERKKKPQIGTLPEERELLESVLASGFTDVGRALDPDNDRLFTWWAPWRNLRQRNIGWRIDYVLASRDLARRATSCQVFRETGTSDHAPVVARFEL